MDEELGIDVQPLQKDSARENLFLNNDKPRVASPVSFKDKPSLRSKKSTGSILEGSPYPDKDNDSLISFDNKSDVAASLSDHTSITSSAHSSSDLKSLLSKAYNVIAEKEQELDQAFKLRRTILDENTKLKAQFEELSDNLTALPIPSVTNNSTTPPLRNSYSGEDPHIKAVEPPTPTQARFQRRSIIRQEVDNINELENLNSALQTRLDSVLAEKENLEKNGRKETRTLLKEIESYRKGLESYSKKIKELEESNQDLIERSRSTSVQSNKQIERRSSMIYPSPTPLYSSSLPLATTPNLRATFNNDINSPIMEEKNEDPDEQKELTFRLLDNIKELEKTNRNLVVSKRQADDKLKQLKKELKTLKLHAAELEGSLKLAEKNSIIIDQQAQKIAELNARLENQRGSIFSSFFSPRSSVSSVSNSNYNVGHNARSQNTSVRMVHNDPRFNTDKAHKRSASASASSTVHRPQRRTLLTELEGEFYRHFNTNSEDRLTAANWTEEAQFSPLDNPDQFNDDWGPEEQDNPDNFPSNSTVRNQPINRTDTLTHSEDDLETVNGEQFQNDESTPLYPPNQRQIQPPVGFVHTMRRCLDGFWKWCKFVALLTAAVGMAMYRGPDSDVFDY